MKIQVNSLTNNSVGIADAIITAVEVRNVDNDEIVKTTGI